MPVKLKKGVKALVDEALKEVETLSIEQVKAAMADPGVQIVDIRDIRELWRDGALPGAFHAPRGMIEFWIDPESPYYKEIFGSGKKFVFFCAGGWRSALTAKTVQDMGLGPVAHMDGGFGAWKKAGFPVEPKSPPPPDKA